jgi:hypothetical protein
MTEAEEPKTLKLRQRSLVCCRSLFFGRVALSDGAFLDAHELPNGVIHQANEAVQKPLLQPRRSG